MVELDVSNRAGGEDDSDRQATKTTGKYWVVIETASNQRYVFGTNKRRANIGASHLIHLVGTKWLDAAVESKNGVEIVVRSSGKAILLVEDREVGKLIVKNISGRALRKAPGLGVWGAVDDVEVDDKNAVERLAAVHQTLSRFGRTAPLLN